MWFPAIKHVENTENQDTYFLNPFFQIDLIYS